MTTRRVRLSEREEWSAGVNKTWQASDDPRLFPTAGSSGEATRDAAQLRAAGDEAMTRRATLSEREEWIANVNTRWQASDEPRLIPNSWLVLRGDMPRSHKLRAMC